MVRHTFIRVGSGLSVRLAPGTTTPLVGTGFYPVNRRNCPFLTIEHFEDGQWVPRCTRGGGSCHGCCNDAPRRPGDNRGGDSGGGGGRPMLRYQSIWNPLLRERVGTRVSGINSEWQPVGQVSIPSFVDGYPVLQVQGFNYPYLRRVVIPNTVQTIMWGSFRDTYLTDVIIGSGVTFIEGQAFMNTPIERLSINMSDISTSTNSSTVFRNIGRSRDGTIGQTLRSLTIGNNVEVIGEGVFAGNRNLASLTIGSNVTTIGSGAFHNAAITSVVIPNSVIRIGGFAEEIRPGSWTWEEGAFAGNTSLRNLTIGNRVAEIGDNTFTRTALTNVAIPDSVTAVGRAAFANNPYLTNITIGSGVNFMGRLAFANNPALANVTIRNGVTTIGEGAFSGNTSLTGIEIPNSVISIGNSAFQNTALTSVVIPDSVTLIGFGAFWGATDLANVSIGSSVTTIGGSAFRNTSLTSIVIPESVITIGSNAFSGNTSLTNVTFRSAMPPTFGTGIFSVATNPNLTTIFVPRGSYAAYRAEPQLRWFNIVEVVLSGDANGDGRVTSADGTMLARYLAGHDVAIDYYSMDLDGTGNVDNEDLIWLARWLVGHDIPPALR